MHHFKAIGEFKLELQSGKAHIGSKSAIFCPVWPWNLTKYLENNRAILLYYVKLSALFQSYRCIQTWVTVWKCSIRVKTSDFFWFRVTLKFDRWPWKTIGHFFYAAFSFESHFVAIGEVKLELQSGNAQFGSKSTFFFSRVTLKFDGWFDLMKNNRAPLLSNIKHCASFHPHMWIQTGVTVLTATRIKGFLTCGTLTFDLWPWPFSWTLLLSMVTTPENFMMNHERNIVKKVSKTDGRTDRRTEVFLELLGRS